MSENKILVHNSCVQWDDDWEILKNSFDAHGVANKVEFSVVGTVIQEVSHIKNNGLRVFINYFGDFNYADVLEVYLEKAAKKGVSEIELRFVVTENFDKLPANGTRVYKDFVSTYDEKRKILQFSNTKPTEYDGFSSGE